MNGCLGNIKKIISELRWSLRMVCVKITKVVLLERKYFKMFPKIIIEFDVNSVLSVGRIRTQMGGTLVLIT